MLKFLAGMVPLAACCAIAQADLIVLVSQVRTATAEAAVLQDLMPFIVETAFDSAVDWSDPDAAVSVSPIQGIQAGAFQNSHVGTDFMQVSIDASSGAQLLQPPHSSIATASAVWDVWFEVTQDTSFQLTGLVGSLGAPDLASQTNFRFISQGNEDTPIIFASPSNDSIVPLEMTGVLTAGVYRITANILTSSANGSTHSAAVNFDLYLSPVPNAPTVAVLVSAVLAQRRRRRP